MFSLFEKIKELCQNRGISINSLEETLGYSRNTIYSISDKCLPMFSVAYQ
nr:MAG TPA: repressor protein [Caudoviricetes sp.]